MAASRKAGEPLRYHLRAFFRVISAASVSTHVICLAKNDLDAMVIAMTGGQAGAGREVHPTPVQCDRTERFMAARLASTGR